MTIGLSDGGTTIYLSTTPSQQILVGTREGAVTIERESQSDWLIAHRAIEDKHISAIITEPQSGLIFAGAFLGWRAGQRRRGQNLGSPQQRHDPKQRLLVGRQ